MAKAEHPLKAGLTKVETLDVDEVRVIKRQLEVVSASGRDFFVVTA